ncbi:MAG: TA system VapC family ribonuclease toxin [Acidobacteriota bacterium]
MAALLDVNMLVALLWHEHTFHTAAQSWFQTHWRKGWATCPLTQSAFVRIISNHSALRNAATPAEAAVLLEGNLQHATHEFWPDDLTLADAVRPFRKHLTGHQQVPHAYLLGLSLHHKSRLITFDRGAIALAAAAGLPNLVSIVSR